MNNDIKSLMKESFIYDKYEVKLTGRIAEKKIKENTDQEKTDTLYEIKVKDGVWSGWCRLRDLYKITKIEGE
jgi:hypothetical protein